MLGLTIEKIMFRDRNLKVNLYYQESNKSRPWPSKIHIFANRLKGEFKVRSEHVATFGSGLFEIG
jgi:hypothetical protein